MWVGTLCCCCARSGSEEPGQREKPETLVAWLGFSCARGAESTFLFPFPIGHSTLGRERGGSTLPPKLALLPHRAAVRPLGS